ncbi:hypothetical protein KPL71_012163 [Citrus sinensis]|uniref:Uncharacterized protein n=1 Tax=Citrus sinensis TaxID=2711 RepID=A0ACB8L967_CITSI|nr:hypothetical protein KPL71_012163 [Citrus sinensis]
MGLLSWFMGNPNPNPQQSESFKSAGDTQNPKSEISAVPGMNGAIEVPRPAESVTVFEFGSVAASADKVTMAGYCPVSDDLEPCRWEILPASDSDAPQFRVYVIVFSRLGLTRTWWERMLGKSNDLRCFHSNMRLLHSSIRIFLLCRSLSLKTLMYPDPLPHIYSCMSSGSSQFPPLSLYSARMGALDAMKTA